MIKLNISQNNEVVKPLDDNIIEFLYQLCKGLDDNVDQYLCGRVEIAHGYADAVDFLTSKFEDFYITSTGSPYIRFKNLNTENKCATTFGDSIGLTVADARLVTAFTSTTFYGSNIGSFDELRYFTNVHTLPHECFKNCANLTSIDLTNITAFNSNGTFNGCTSLTTIKNYRNITRCGDGVFGYCNLIGDFDFSNITEFNNNNKCALGFDNNVNLTSVKLPEAQETLCRFYACTNLKHITNGINIKTIPYEALLGCISLEELNFPNLETIEQSAVRGCSKLTSIDLSNVTSIGNWAFDNCTNLKTVNVPNLTTIGYGTFQYCSNLTTIDLSNVTSISGWAFRNCSNLTTVDLSACTSIGESAFYSCTKLTSVSIPLVTVIPQSCFEGCTLLETININWSNITSIDSWGFAGCNNFTNNGEILELTNCLTCKSVPPYVEHIKLPALLSNTGFSGKGIKYLELNDALTTISGRMYDMTALISITGLSNIENITTDGLFTFNVNLTSIDFTSKLKILPKDTFYECRAIQHVSTDILKPTRINESCFNKCNNLLSDKLDLSECTFIGNYAFNKCSNLSTVDLSACTSIGEFAFSECTKLTSIGSLNENLTELLKSTFSECTLLNNITLPSSVTTLGNNVFYNCKSLTSIDISNVTSLGDSVFMNCELLTSIGSLNENLTEIPMHLFWGCSNLSGDIIIPIGVTYLGEACFLGCNSLHSIKFQSAIPPSYNTKAYDPFIQLSNNVIIYVPQANINDYLAVKIFADRSSSVIGY